MDRHFQRRAVRTSFAKGLVEWLITMVLAFGHLLYPIAHLALVHLTVAVTVVSSSVQPHHYLFLLPYLPSIIAFILQALLFQHYVKPKTAEDQWYAFLSLFIPIRIFLIASKEKAFSYFKLSTAVSFATSVSTWVIFTLVAWSLPEEEDEKNGFFIFCLEVILPIAFHISTLWVVLSLSLW